MIEFSILCLERHKMQDALSQILPIVDSVHLDIMDGEFVPSTAYSPEFINAFETTLPKHVHVMSYNPENYLTQLYGIDSFTFHIEAVDKPLELVEKVKNRGIKAGICINPETAIESITPLVPYVDRILLMAVNPGFSGQKYIPKTSEKIIRLRLAAPNIEIVIDGGMHEDTIREVMTLGSDACVVCSVIVKSNDWKVKIEELKESIQVGRNNKLIMGNSTEQSTRTIEKIL